MARVAFAAAFICALVAVGAGLSAEGPVRTVTMLGKAFDPPALDVLVGTTVTWRNDDATNHTVTAADDTFGSGYIPPGGSFSHTFARQGSYAITCTIHRSMRGTVNVYGIVLAGPEAPVTAGRRVVFAGLAPPGTATVSLRGGPAALTVRPRADGSFALRFPVGAPARYRAVAGPLSSPPVRVVVKPVVRATARGGSLQVTASPPRPGAAVLLQAYDRERFAWLDVARGRLDRGSRALLAIPVGTERVRAVVRGTRGWADAASSGIVLERR